MAALTPSADGYVSVAGLRIPAPLAVRIIAAIRSTYPSVVADRDDEGAVRAVLIHWITTTLSAYEGQQADLSAEETVARLRAEAAEKAAKAREKAVADAKYIQETPTPPPAQEPTP